jgi:hypothetical protein
VILEQGAVPIASQIGITPTNVVGRPARPA